ncbi:MAG: GNAT family N-acetyltransferase [Dokdonella sp.]
MNDPSGALVFRRADEADLDAIRSLVESAYRGDASRQGWTTEADLLDGQRIDIDGLRELVGNTDTHVLIGLREGNLTACCELRRDCDTAYFGMFSVRPDGQGAGVGNRVLAEAERIAHDEWRCRGMQMTVIDIRSELIAWYERRGYRRTGVHRPFPYGDVRYGIPKRDDLRFEVLEKVFA